MIDSRHFFLFFCVCLLTDGQELNTRLLGGDPALPEEYPFMASIRVLGDHYCGGIIVHERWILTVGHCIFNQTEGDLSVVVGTTSTNAGGIYNKVKTIVIHELHRYVLDVDALHDIGLLLLENPLRFNRYVAKAKLTTRMFQPRLNTVLIGWGRTSPTATTPSVVLNRLAVETISNRDCARLLTNRTINYGSFCTGAIRVEGGCYGDSGSPLIEQVTNEIVGIYSWVVPPCGSGLPDGYTDVWLYLDWIKMHIGSYE